MKIDPGDAVSDVLTTVLNALQFKGKVFFYSKFSAPWAIRLKRKDYAHFHFFERGQGWVQLEETGAETLAVSGDLVIFPHGGAHLNARRPEIKSRECRRTASLSRCTHVATRRRRSGNYHTLWRIYFREPIWKSDPAAPPRPDPCATRENTKCRLAGTDAQTAGALRRKTRVRDRAQSSALNRHYLRASRARLD